VSRPTRGETWLELLFQAMAKIVWT